MRRYLDKEYADEMIRLEASNFMKASELCNTVCDVVRKFDGRVLNVRFMRALTEATGYYVNVEDNDYHFRISISVKDQNKIFDRSESSCGRVEYVINKDIIICNMMYPEEYPLCGKRILAENIIKSIQSTCSDLKSKSLELSDSITKSESWKQRFENLRKELEDLSHEIPYEAQEYYDLYWRIVQ